MKIGILSDLHMEFDRRGISFKFKPEPDVFYICAGDISSDPWQYNDFIETNKPHMFCIDGNHDYYNNGRSFNESKDDLRHRIIDNRTQVAGATLWTDLNSSDKWNVFKRGMADYRWISDITHERYQETHKHHADFLLRSDVDYDIIVSHHCPSSRSVNPKYAGDPLNNCFYTELSDQILAMEHKPKLWIHGHTHEEFDYMIGDTRVICHPRGYPREQPWYYDYQPKIVEI